MAGRREETPYEEAAELSALQGAALPGLHNESEDVYDDFDDPDIADLNNPDVETLAEPPLLGAKPRSVDLGFGEEAQPFGRATSPKLYSSAAQFPTAVQYRVWRWENGVPVGLGAIDAEATEEDFVRSFMSAMPRAGQGNYQFRMRPIDIRGQELGKEFTINISEHHATLRQLRDLKRREEEEKMNGGGGWGRGGGDVHVHGGGGQGYDQAGASYAEEMGRMFEQAVESAEDQNRALRDTLESERDRLRTEESRRTEERVSMAERSAGTVEKMMERLMTSDRSRSDEAMQSQKQHSEVLMGTLTTVFSQQQEAGRQQHDRQREADASRMQQDREFFDRQRQETESRRSREREEAETRRRAERDEAEAKRRAEKEEWESQRLKERDESDRRRRADGEDWERKRIEERERLTNDQRRWEEARKHESEQLRLDAQRRESEMESRREQEKEEARTRLEREKMEFERKAVLEREERVRREDGAKEERDRREKGFERKILAEREERERRDRADRERWERERQESERKREEERREWERRESLRRDELARETERRREETQQDAARRREEMQLQMKTMEMNAQRDREHAERMGEMARLERDAQREASLQREKADRDGREHAERDRQRQHDLQVREMELSKERDREHAERMLQMTKMERTGGISGITEMLGMETPEVLSRIFGGAGAEGEGGWADAIPKVLAAVAEVGAKTLGQKAGPPPEPQGRRRRAETEAQPKPKMIAIQTPDGVKMISADALAHLQAQRAQAGIPIPAHQPPDDDFPSDLPTSGFMPEMDELEDDETPHAAQPRRAAPASAPGFTAEPSAELLAAAEVNTVKRAKVAGMKFSAQRTARRALRDLIPRLEAANEDEWIGVITEAIVKQPVIYEYLKTVTVYAALAEAKVAPAVIERTVEAMKKSGLIPDDVPYDEADLVRLMSEATVRNQTEANALAEADIPPGWPDVKGDEPPRLEDVDAAGDDEGGDE